MSGRTERGLQPGDRLAPYNGGVDPFNSALTTLFLEVFRGTAPGESGTYFVQGGEALDDTLAALSADEASRQIPGGSSIAAHVIHTAYYLDLSNDALRGTERQGDWESSWKVQNVDEAAWDAAKEELRAQKEEFLAFVAECGMPSKGYQFGELLANLGHAAYHLGAVRQIYLWLKATG